MEVGYELNEAYKVYIPEACQGDQGQGDQGQGNQGQENQGQDIRGQDNQGETSAQTSRNLQRRGNFFFE